MDHFSNEWMKEAACRNNNPFDFFPSSKAGVELAKTICAGCVVMEDCLQFALTHHIDHGVWGGASESERRKMLKDTNKLR